MDSECKGSLVCGHRNCMNSTLTRCCTHTCNYDSECLNQECNTDVNQCRLDSLSTNWSFCNEDSYCNEGEGDCDNDSECVGALVCGIDNCASGPSYMDCCSGTFDVFCA